MFTKILPFRTRWTVIAFLVLQITSCTQVGLGITDLPIHPVFSASLIDEAAVSDPVIAAAGDIACDPNSRSFKGGDGTDKTCRQKYTADLMLKSDLSAVLALGDTQYYCGSYVAHMLSYDKSWGRLKSITHPTVGNHEYLTDGGTGCDTTNAGAAGYFRYFGESAGEAGEGYYSFDIGAWHLIALNTNCSTVGGCSPTSPQGKWLQADLDAHKNFCTLAFWHIPLFSSGGRANDNSKFMWQQLYDHDADLVLTAHDHIYERFAPMTAKGELDLERGMRSFVVGTGGAELTDIVSLSPNSETRNAHVFGVLMLTLHASSYDWNFVTESGADFSDSGSGQCH